jgi:hypothetical protein
MPGVAHRGSARRHHSLRNPVGLPQKRPPRWKTCYHQHSALVDEELSNHTVSAVRTALPAGSRLSERLLLPSARCAPTCQRGTDWKLSPGVEFNLATRGSQVGEMARAPVRTSVSTPRRSSAFPSDKTTFVRADFNPFQAPRHLWPRHAGLAAPSTASTSGGAQGASATGLQSHAQPADGGRCSRN